MQKKNLKNIIKYISFISILVFLTFIFILKNDKKINNNELKIQTIPTLPNISVKEKEALKKLYKDMKLGLFEEAANVIIDNSNIFENLFQNTLEDTPYLFDGENLLDLKSNDNNKYLLIHDASTFYYGYIKFEKPYGKGNIIHAYKSDFKRYNYSFGTWSYGKLNGFGETGRAIVGEVPANTNVLYSLKGDFKDDLLDSSVELSIIDEKGIINMYKFNIKKGSIVIDNNLEYNRNKKSYEISSIFDELKKYTIKESEIYDIQWINSVIF